MQLSKIKLSTGGYGQLKRAGAEVYTRDQPPDMRESATLVHPAKSWTPAATHGSPRPEDG